MRVILLCALCASLVLANVGSVRKCTLTNGVIGHCLKSCVANKLTKAAASRVKKGKGCPARTSCCYKKATKATPPTKPATKPPITPPPPPAVDSNGLYNPPGSIISNPGMAPAPPAGAVGAYDDAFNQEMVAAHNSYRATKGLPPLAINTYLAEQAALQAANGFYHQNCYGVLCGQNLCSGATSAQQCADLWWAEGESVGYSCPVVTMSNFGNIGHYTQMVWKTTKLVGCAYNTDTQVIACNYNPTGNYVGSAAC